MLYLITMGKDGKAVLHYQSDSIHLVRVEVDRLEKPTHDTYIFNDYNRRCSACIPFTAYKHSLFMHTTSLRMDADIPKPIRALTLLL